MIPVLLALKAAGGWFLRSVGLPALVFGAGALAVFAILFGAKRAGRTAERAEQLERITHAVREKAKRDRAVDTYTPDELDQRMREQQHELRRLLRPR